MKVTVKRKDSRIPVVIGIGDMTSGVLGILLKGKEGAA